MYDLFCNIYLFNLNLISPVFLDLDEWDYGVLRRNTIIQIGVTVIWSLQKSLTVFVNQLIYHTDRRNCKLEFTEIVNRFREPVNILFQIVIYKHIGVRGHLRR